MNLSILVYFDECSDCLSQLEEDSGVSTVIVAKACEKKKLGFNFAKIKACQDNETQVQGSAHETRVQWLKRKVHMKPASELQT